MAGVRLDIQGARADLVFDRPGKRNALDLAIWSAIPGLLSSVAEDDRIRVLVVRGAGGAFAAGADIAEFATAYATPEAARANQRTMNAAMDALEAFPKPVLAQIDGPCIGGGCAVALCCDIRVAARDARFAITPAKLGLAYGVADTRRLVSVVGPSRAKDMLFTGRIMNAQEAMRIGLVDRVADSAAEETAALTQQLLDASGYTARAVKIVFSLLRRGEREDGEASAALFSAAFSGTDFKEGFAAFMAKRPPEFR
ncbi:MAG: enoyl-CoA hydratase-related protein [Hyphomonadaceae bacterium]|nr:enoyl-CoA hydratase-related protein [Hyphomonadaceae bacterium]